jgi:hypothetical protein
MEATAIRSAMTSRMHDRVQARAHAAQEAYAGSADRPLGGYVRVMGVYGGAVGLASLLLRRSGKRLPERIELADIALLAVATHKASRLLTKEAVTSPLRAPFTRFDGVSGPNELQEEVRHPDGVKHALGELLTCPFCMAQWLATGFGFGLVVAPRLTRMVAAVLAVRAASDVLQYGYAIAQQRASND